MLFLLPVDKCFLLSLLHVGLNYIIRLNPQKRPLFLFIS